MFPPIQRLGRVSAAWDRSLISREAVPHSGLRPSNGSADKPRLKEMAAKKLGVLLDWTDPSSGGSGTTTELMRCGLRRRREQPEHDLSPNEIVIRAQKIIRL